jgi:hypothetical protein
VVEGTVTVGSNEKVFAIFMLCGIIGILFAIIFQLLYDQGIFIDEFISGTVTLRELQFITILVWELLGIGVAAVAK